MLRDLEKTAYIHPSWLQVLEKEFEAPYMKRLESFLKAEYKGSKEIYPPFSKIFNAFCITSFDQVKVVIMGQDPYHGKGQAEGLSFSVSRGVLIPPSLQNIYKEIQEDLSIAPPSHGSLISWAEQGVLLLNATLTVRASEPKSHYGQGWETFTDRVVEILSKRDDPLVFLLWGKSAQEKVEKVSLNPKHLILKSAHPSPFSAYSGFFGSRHFSKANAFLQSVGKKPIDWRIRESAMKE